MKKYSVALMWFLLSGCNGAGAAPQWNLQLQDVMQKRGEVVQWRGAHPWESLAAYIDFWSEQRGQTEAWYQTIRASGADAFCGQLFLRPEEWKKVQVACTRGDFFLCHPAAERPRTLMLEWWNAQSKEFRQEWTRSPQCRALAEDWQRMNQ